MFFSVLKFWFPRLSRGCLSVYRTLYFMNHISYDLHIWCTCMYKSIISPAIFFIFFKILIFEIISWGEVKRQKMDQNYKNFCLYLRSCTSHVCDFWCTCVKWWYLQQVFSFFKILIFEVFRGIKGKKWAKITNFGLFCSIFQGL